MDLVQVNKEFQAGLLEMSVETLDWPRGKMPPHLYVAIHAHAGIWRFYQSHNQADEISVHSTSIGKILGHIWELGGKFSYSKLNHIDRTGRPDIFNVTQKRLIEVKKHTRYREGCRKRDHYIAAFKRAGIGVRPEQPGAPGTKGALVFPGFYVVFRMSEAGVIEYRSFTVEPISSDGNG